MKKDFTRDYATEAFRYYALMGRPTYEELEADIMKKASNASKDEVFGTSGNISKPTEYEVFVRENAVEQYKAELMDILAVNKVMDMLKVNDTGTQIIKALEGVYFESPWRELKRGEVSQRVLKTGQEILFCSEKTVYRYLRHAREMFAVERGLRLSSKNNAKK